MSDTMLLGVLRMPFGLAMATPTAQIQYHQRGVQAADEIEKLTRQRDEARAEVENLYDQVHRWVDDRAKAQARADRLREQNYELQRERDEARAEIERQARHIEELREKIDAEGSCACSLDAPGDICAAHSPALMRARAEVERLTGKLKLVADALNETISKYDEVGDQNDRLDAENERLREALHRVSLASQNSMSSKDECGRIAREALEAKP